MADITAKVEGGEENFHVQPDIRLPVSRAESRNKVRDRVGERRVVISWGENYDRATTIRQPRHQAARRTPAENWRDT